MIMITLRIVKEKGEGEKEGEIGGKEREGRREEGKAGEMREIVDEEKRGGIREKKG